MEEDIITQFIFEINDVMDRCLHGREITATEYMFIKQRLLLKIEDLVRKNKKLEKENRAVKSANEYWTMRFCEATKKNAEQEKIIKLMAEYMATHKYIGYDFEHAFPQEIIEEFKVKAKGE